MINREVYWWSFGENGLGGVELVVYIYGPICVEEMYGGGTKGEE